MNSHASVKMSSKYILSYATRSFLLAIIVAILLPYRMKSQMEPNLPIMQNNFILGDPTCPCLGEQTHVNSPKEETINGTCIDIRIETNFQDKSQATFCYPISYGTSCGQHDLNLAPFCNHKSGENLPGMCDQPWCYVDISKCQLSQNNTYFRSLYFNHLYFSYSTCGGGNTWEDLRVVKQLEGTTLRVGIPLQNFPDHYRLNEDGSVILHDPDIFKGVSDLKGMYIDYLRILAMEAKFEIEYHAPSSGALAHTSNNYDACLSDVERGILDMCVGNFWETTPRKKKIQFTTSIFNDVYYLVVPLPRADGRLSTQTKKIFEPFTNGLWLTIALVTVAVGISYAIITTNREFTFVDFWSNIFGYIYTAYIDMMSSSSTAVDNSHKFAKRSIALTWALFTLIIVTAYTANLAAFLSKKKQRFRIQNIEECIAQDCLVCAVRMGPLIAQAQRLYPTLRTNGEFATPEDLIDAVMDRTCDAALVSQLSWRVTERYWGDCDTSFVGNKVLFLRDGWPVSDDISIAMSYWIGKSQETEEFEKVARVYQPPQKCLESIESIQISEGAAKQIDVIAMAGPLSILCGGLVIGYISKFGGFVVRKTLRRRE